MGYLQNLKITLEMIKWEHSIFALPFALCGAMLAAGGLPTGHQLAWIVIAMVSAASSEIPPSLFAQLREGGRMIIPIGQPASQELQLIRKVKGQPEVQILEGCRFVPLVEGRVPED